MYRNTTVMIRCDRHFALSSCAKDGKGCSTLVLFIMSDKWVLTNFGSSKVELKAWSNRSLLE